MISRLVYLFAGVCALYMALAPSMGSLPNSRPAWVTVACFSGAISLIVAAVLGTRSVGGYVAAIGSGTILALYCCNAAVLILIRLGYYRFQTRLVAGHESLADRWRFVLDRPVLYLLLLTALVSLALSFHSIGKRKNLRSVAGD